MKNKILKKILKSFFHILKKYFGIKFLKIVYENNLNFLLQPVDG